MNSYSPSSAPAPQKRGNKTLIIILCVVGALFLFAAYAVSHLGAKLGQSMGNMAKIADNQFDTAGDRSITERFKRMHEEFDNDTTLLEFKVKNDSLEKITRALYDEVSSLHKGFDDTLKLIRQNGDPVEASEAYFVRSGRAELLRQHLKLVQETCFSYIDMKHNPNKLIFALQSKSYDQHPIGSNSSWDEMNFGSAGAMAGIQLSTMKMLLQSTIVEALNEIEKAAKLIQPGKIDSIQKLYGDTAI